MKRKQIDQNVIQFQQQLMKFQNLCVRKQTFLLKGPFQPDRMKKEL